MRHLTDHHAKNQKDGETPRTDEKIKNLDPKETDENKGDYAKNDGERRCKEIEENKDADKKDLCLFDFRFKSVGI